MIPDFRTSSLIAGSALWLALAPAAAGEQPQANSAVVPVVVQNAMGAEDYAACTAELEARKVAFEALGSVTVEGCTLAGAIKLRAIASRHGAVQISGEPIMLCSFARQFTGWVGDVGAPLAFAYTGEALARIETGPGLVCRTRYNKPGEKVSEHAKGNAIDIASFVLTGKTRIAVKQSPKDSQVARDLLRAFRATGCGYFTTILGPGSNAAHEEHLHFDYGMHGKTLNYRICE
jgi:hypothetical protein